MTRSAALLIIASLLAATPAGANDATAELRTGGIAPIQSDAIEMVAEDLFLSMDEVRVDYLFRNRADAPVAATIAFPTPDIASGEDVNVALPRRDAVKRTPSRLRAHDRRPRAALNFNAWSNVNQLSA